MTQVIQQRPASPKQASRRKSDLDRLLEAPFFKAIGEPTRAKLLSCLIKCGRPCSVSEVAECCALDFSMVARHLALLARAGLLESRKDGRTMWYAASAEDLASRFRDLAGAIESWSAAECCAESGCGCKPERRRG